MMIEIFMPYLLYILLILYFMTSSRGKPCLSRYEWHSVLLCSCWAVFTGKLFLMGLAPLFLYIALYDQKYEEIPEPAQWIFLILILYCRRDYFIAWAVLVLAGGTLLSAAGMIGFGDVRLFAAAALFLGEQIVLVTALASLSCLLLNGRKKGSHEEIPFAPYICFAILAVSVAQWQFEPEGAAFMQGAVHTVCRMMHLQYFFHNG